MPVSIPQSFRIPVALAVCLTVLQSAAVSLQAGDSAVPEAVASGDADGEVPLAGALLAGVVQQLPRHPIRVTGELLVRRQRGVPVATYGFELIARWGDRAPQSQYTIRDAFGQPLEQLTLAHGENPTFSYAAGSDLVPAPMSSLGLPIQGSDITWMDLTLSFLWWTDARHEREDSVRGFDCYVILVNAPAEQPGPYRCVRLWISKKGGMMLRAEGLDAESKPVRQLWVRSVKKMDDDAWMIKDMEIQKIPAVQRTKLSVSEVERL